METASTLYFWPPSQVSRPIIPRLSFWRGGNWLFVLVFLFPGVASNPHYHGYRHYCCHHHYHHHRHHPLTIPSAHRYTIYGPTSHRAMYIQGARLPSTMSPTTHDPPSPSPINHDAKRRERWPIVPGRTCFVSSSPGGSGWQTSGLPGMSLPRMAKESSQSLASGAAPNVTALLRLSPSHSHACHTCSWVGSRSPAEPRTLFLGCDGCSEPMQPCQARAPMRIPSAL